MNEIDEININHKNNDKVDWRAFGDYIPPCLVNNTGDTNDIDDSVEGLQDLLNETENQNDNNLMTVGDIEELDTLVGKSSHNVQPKNKYLLNKYSDVHYGKNSGNNTTLRSGRVRLYQSYFLNTHVGAEVERLQDSMIRIFVCADGKIKVPRSYKEVLKHIKRDEWLEAIKDEYNSLMKNNTWELVAAPHGSPVVGSKWVFTLKFNVDGTIKRYKARLVAQGFSQTEGVDYFETFSPVVNQVTLKLVLATAVKKGWNLNQMDFQTAFLNSPVNEKIYVRQAPGFVVQGKEGHVYLLKKSLYGLKQAPRNWSNMLSTFLTKDVKLEQSQVDPCLFYHNSDEGVVLMCVYVDDVIITGSNKKLIHKIKQRIMSEFKCTDLGEAKQLLGLVIENDIRRGELKIHQEPYVQKLLEEYEDYLKYEREVDTPATADTYTKYVDSVFRGDERTMEFPYREAIGALLFLSVSTRPDISNIIRFLSGFVSNYTDFHIKCVKRVFKYLEGTANLGLIYRKGDSEGLSSNVSSLGANEMLKELNAMSDASWGDHYFDATSSSGVVVQLFGNLICWKSVKQRIVARSTSESEYIAMATAVDEVQVCMNILLEIGMKTELENKMFIDFKRKENNLIGIVNEAVTLYGDNKAAICVGNATAATKRSRIINVKFHTVKNAVYDKLIKLKYVKSEDNLADMFTKCLGGPTFSRLRNQLMG